MLIHRSHQKQKETTAEEPLIDTGITVANNTEDALDEVDINDICESSASESETDSDSD